MKLNRTLIVLVLAMLPAVAHAKDEQRLFDIASVMGSPEARERFDETIRFYWTGQTAPTPLQTFKIHISERKTFSPTRTEREACDQSFVEALAALRDAARAAGANAVVEIKSLYKNREFRSSTEYECRLGYFAAGVTLEGSIVRLAPAGAAPTAAEPVPAPEAPAEGGGFQPSGG